MRSSLPMWRFQNGFRRCPRRNRAFNLSRLPEDAGENIRIVTIGDYDTCPCIGPHVDVHRADRHLSDHLLRF